MSQTPLTDVERCAHYRELAIQFRDWAAGEPNPGARDGLIGMAIRSAGRRTHGQNRSGPSGEAGLSSPIASRFSREPHLARAAAEVARKTSLSLQGLTRGSWREGQGEGVVRARSCAMISLKAGG